MAQGDWRNPQGAVCLFDGGNLRTVTFKARENISGGYWVNGSSALAVVGSGINTYAASDIEGYTVSTQVGSQVIGLCLNDTASGTYGVATQRGTWLMPVLSGTAIGSVYAGQRIHAGSAGTVGGLISGLSWNAAAAGFVDFGVGRALTQGDASVAGGQFVAVSLNI
jgi:hypothetical protein